MLKAAITYFAITFGTGFLLGLIRVLLLVPRLGERTSELIETPFMLIAIVLAANGLKRLYVGRPQRALGVGLLALVLLVAAEVVFVVTLRRMSISEYIASRDRVSGAVYLAMVMVFALAPWFVARRR